MVKKRILIFSIPVIILLGCQKFAGRFSSEEPRVIRNIRKGTDNRDVSVVAIVSGGGVCSGALLCKGPERNALMTVKHCLRSEELKVYNSPGEDPIAVLKSNTALEVATGYSSTDFPNDAIVIPPVGKLPNSGSPFVIGSAPVGF